MIIVTDPARPLPRAAKGTVVRAQALALYADEIDKLYVVHSSAPCHSLTFACRYQVVEESLYALHIAAPNEWSTENIAAWLASVSSTILGGGAAIHPSRDIFDQGFDR
jgi:hypothetical protein